MPTPLHFRYDGTFTVVQFTDLHWHNGEPADLQTRDLMTEILDDEEPDLALLTGDVIDGAGCRDPAWSWQEAVAPLVARAVPWAAVFGNHDDEGNLSRQELMGVQVALPGCLSEPGPGDVSGVGNYVLPIGSAHAEQGADGQHQPTAAVLYCLDSNSYAETDVGGYGWIRHDQVGWYLETAAALRAENNDEPLPALAFFHIPVPEYGTVWETRPCRGFLYEPVCCPRINTGFFAALHLAGDVLGTFAGHDHVNDYMGELHGIRLCYGRGSGFNTYGREGFARGARVIRLVEGERDFQTWLRLEGGARVEEQPWHYPPGQDPA